MFIKIEVLQNFANFTGRQPFFREHFQWLFLGKETSLFCIPMDMSIICFLPFLTLIENIYNRKKG